MWIAGETVGEIAATAPVGTGAVGAGAEAFARDAKGDAYTSGILNPLQLFAKRLTKLGPEAAMVDAGRTNTMQLLDTLATLPGRTKDATANFRRARMVGEGARQMPFTLDKAPPDKWNMGDIDHVKQGIDQV